MGMGDKKQAFNPSYAPILCNVSGKMFAPCTMRQCNEPHVVNRYGIGGICNVSIYVCRKCRYHKKDPLCGALKCGYELDESVQPGT